MVLWIAVYTTAAKAGQAGFSDPWVGNQKAKSKAAQQTQKILPPSSKTQTPARNDVRQPLKSSPSFKKAPSDDRKNIKDSLEQVE